MPLSLSTCWNSHRHEEGLDLAREAAMLGFEYIEVSHGTKISLLPGLFKAVEAGIIKVSSLHNFCPPPVEVLIDAPDAYEFTSDDEANRERAMNLTRQTIRTAAKLGVDRIVLHLGSVRIKRYTDPLEAMVHAGEIYSRAYIDLKLQFVTERQRVSAVYFERARAALKALLPEAEQAGVRLAIETRSHYEQVPDEKEMQALLSEFQDSPFIGAWHDFGHVQRKANLGLLNHAEQLRCIAPRLLGCHVHDVDWPAKDHRVPLSTGGVAFDDLLPMLPPGLPLVWEMSPSQRRSQVQEAVKTWTARYGM